MPFAVPSLPQIKETLTADIHERLPDPQNPEYQPILRALSNASAEAIHDLYNYLTHLSQQIFIDTAETPYLEQWGQIWGIQRKASQAATGQVILEAKDERADGIIIVIGSRLQRPGGGEYITRNQGIIIDGQAVVNIQAVEAGEDGNLAPGTLLNLAPRADRIQLTATVGAKGMTGGRDAESDDQLRQRILLRIQRPPQGGARDDYREWTSKLDGVTRVWVSPGESGIGTVTVRFMMDDDYKDGIPQAADLDRVQTDLDERRPVTAQVIVVAPIAVPLDIIDLEIEPDTPEIRAAIEAAIADLILRKSGPGQPILIADIEEAISQAVGAGDYNLGSPNGDIHHRPGEIAVVGRFPWRADRGNA